MSTRPSKARMIFWSLVDLVILVTAACLISVAHGSLWYVGLALLIAEGFLVNWRREMIWRPAMFKNILSLALGDEREQEAKHKAGNDAFNAIMALCLLPQLAWPWMMHDQSYVVGAGTLLIVMLLGVAVNYGSLRRAGVRLDDDLVTEMGPHGLQKELSRRMLRHHLKNSKRIRSDSNLPL